MSSRKSRTRINSRSVSSNTSSLYYLNKPKIQRNRQKEAIETMDSLESQKSRNDMFNEHIRREKYQIDFLKGKIRLLEEEIEKIQNKNKMNKTISLNNQSMTLMSDSKIPKNKREIIYLKDKIEDIKINIKILEKGEQKTNNEMKKLQDKLNILNLSIGGRTKKTRKRRTLKKK